MATVALLAAVLVAIGWWGARHGYLAPNPVVGGACVLTVYDDEPTYNELINDHGNFRFCARAQLNETWYDLWQ